MKREQQSEKEKMPIIPLRGQIGHCKYLQGDIFPGKKFMFAAGIATYRFNGESVFTYRLQGLRSPY